MFNGYENLDRFKDVEEHDLESLGIRDLETKNKLLSAASSLLGYESIGDSCSSSVIIGQVSELSSVNNTSSRDSGCYADSKTTSLAAEPSEDQIRSTSSSVRIAPPACSSPSSTDNSSSGYQSRDNYANVTINTLHEVPDNTFDSTSSSSSTGENASLPGDSSSVKTLFNLNDRQNTNQLTKDSSSPSLQQNSKLTDKTCGGSYRATPAVVRPGTPEHQK